ncbi:MULTISPECIES: helix-turn-helix domain-containing protein [unclassified Paenibacillus]|uniref:helix-turn-helix domain-containing protein n=1 Tax=unclassified Paenibacillus TaxID=185978 RepID=UPI00097103E4|nr:MULTISPECIES: helix-turn-helix domain-containing protein [unclassified Paenibacillus]
MNDNTTLGTLLILAKSGNQEAMQLIIDRLRPLIKKLSRRVQDIGMREQIEQELIEEIIRIVKKFEPKHSELVDAQRGDSTE